MSIPNSASSHIYENPYYGGASAVPIPAWLGISSFHFLIRRLMFATKLQKIYQKNENQKISWSFLLRVAFCTYWFFFSLVTSMMANSVVLVSDVRSSN